MTKYTLEVDDELWEEWKDTVPRSKTLNDRIVKLIEEDLKEAKKNG